MSTRGQNQGHLTSAASQTLAGVGPSFLKRPLLRGWARGAVVAVLGWLALFNVGSLAAQFKESIPAAEEGTGVDRREGEMVDGGLTFTDDQNRFVGIGDFFDGRRPVVLSFNYSNCPNICSVQLEKMALALRDVDLEVLKDFQVVSVSIDPNEQVSRARETKEKFTSMYNRPERNEGWHFLTGDNSQIQALAAQCGVRYKYIPEQKLYSHPPVFLLLSPQGKIVRYIYGLDYEPATIKQALVEAAAGKIGSPINQLTFLTGCYLFDETTGKYAFQAMALMRLGGIVTVIGLCVGLLPYWLFRRGQPKDDQALLKRQSESTLAPKPTDTI